MMECIYLLMIIIQYKQRNYFMNDKPLHFYLNKKVKILEEENLNNNITSENCKNCFVHLSKNNKSISVEQRKNSFQLFVKPNCLFPTCNSYYVNEKFNSNFRNRLFSDWIFKTSNLCKR